ncbi:hypothetical protein H2248_011121 [Termitomyces sp. 'cryptogamus']|nr:hypothetical protein H2248_011121 [Termitomyces sp. 'cryptogamus']
MTEPNSSTKPVAYANWLANNDLIIGIIQTAVSKAEQDGLKTNGTAKECYSALKARAQCKGPVKQVVLIHKALTTYAPIAEPVKTLAQKICDLINHTFVIGTIDKDLLNFATLSRTFNTDTVLVTKDGDGENLPGHNHGPEQSVL